MTQYFARLPAYVHKGVCTLRTLQREGSPVLGLTGEERAADQVAGSA
jgi:hypothetical protein